MELRSHDPRKADVVELTYLVGLEHEEVAKVLDVSLATVNRDLRFARVFLRDRIRG
jgi:DNA-directed RNA polymerase specialized sigma24 family protein